MKYNAKFKGKLQQFIQFKFKFIMLKESSYQMRCPSKIELYYTEIFAEKKQSHL